LAQSGQLSWQFLAILAGAAVKHRPAGRSDRRAGHISVRRTRRLPRAAGKLLRRLPSFYEDSELRPRGRDCALDRFVVDWSMQDGGHDPETRRAPPNGLVASGCIEHHPPRHRKNVRVGGSNKRWRKASLCAIYVSIYGSMLIDELRNLG